MRYLLGMMMLCGVALADDPVKLHLKNGKKVEGTLLAIDLERRTFELRTPDNEHQTIPLADLNEENRQIVAERLTDILLKRKPKKDPVVADEKKDPAKAKGNQDPGKPIAKDRRGKAKDVAKGKKPQKEIEAGKGEIRIEINDDDEGNFVGVINDNGKERRFNNKEEYEEAMKEMQDRLPQIGRGIKIFRGSININGQKTDFEDEEEFKKAKERADDKPSSSSH